MPTNDFTPWKIGTVWILARFNPETKKFEGILDFQIRRKGPLIVTGKKLAHIVELCQTYERPQTALNALKKIEEMLPYDTPLQQDS